MPEMLPTRNCRRPLVAGVGLAAALLLAAAPLSAANREHQQIMADIRMLQEQNAQLQQSLATLLEALKAVTSKIDQQGATASKTAADQKVLIDGLSREIRIVREKLDDTNVRLGSISQEVDALRNSIPLIPTGIPPATDPSASTSAADPNAPPPADGAPAGAPAAPPATPSVAGMSPGRLWDIAYSDYAAGQWALAIQGFETYLRTFPRTEQSDDAQYYIGEAYQLDGKPKEALAAYERVITDYPTSDRAADAYYKRGVMYALLNQPDRARESFEAAIQKFPDSEASTLSKQRLSSLPPPR